MTQEWKQSYVKIGRSSKRNFTKEYVEMKQCSTVLIFTEMKVKITMKLHCITTRLSKVKMTDDTVHGKEVE